MTAGQQTTEGQAHLMVLTQQHPADRLDQGNSSGAAKRSRQALLQVHRSSEQTLEEASINAIGSPGCVGAASQGVSQSSNLLELERAINRLEPEGRPQCRRGRAADSWFRGQHQPLAFQPTGAGRTDAHLRHRSARFRP